MSANPIARAAGFLLLLLLVGCNIPSGSTPEADPAAAADPDPGAATPGPEVEITDPTLAVIGPMEIVYDWATQRCDYDDRPDMALRPFRDVDGNVQVNRSWPYNRRFVGPDLDSIEPLCEITMASDFDKNPANFNNEEWFQSLYTEDGQTIHAIVHNEHNDAGTRFWTITYAVSTDGGKTFTQPEAPNHFVAGSPYGFIPDSGLYGLLQGSNIIKGPDGAYYMLVANRTYAQESYTCLFRTEDLSDPAAWRAWGGKAFDWKPVNPFVEEVASPSTRDCPPIDSNYGGGIGISESLIYNTYLERYVSVVLGHFQSGSKFRWGIVYSTSEDLINWENKKFLQETLNSSLSSSGGPDTIGYVVLIDPDSETRNFETADKDAYVYFVSFNHFSAMMWADSDQMRFPVEFFPNEEQALAADVRTRLTAKRVTNTDRIEFQGELTTWGGAPLAAKPVDLVAMLDDDTGMVHEYTFTGTVPVTATQGNVGLRVNGECNCSGPSELFIYEFSYVEEGGANLVQGNRFQRGLETFFKWGTGRAALEASDLGEGRMLHAQAATGEDIYINSWDFSVTPGAEFTYTVKARVVPGSFGTGFFGLFMRGETWNDGLRVTVPFYSPPIRIGAAVTDENGQYSIPWPDAPSGRYEIKATYAGSGDDWESKALMKTIVR